MAPQTRRRIDPFGSGTYLRVRAETERAGLLGLGHPRTARQSPINHLGRPRQRAEAGVQSCGRTGAPEAAAAVLRRLDGVGQFERVLAALVAEAVGGRRTAAD